MHPGTGCGSGTEGTLKRAGGTWQQHAVTPFRRHPSVPWHGGGLLHTVCREPIGRNERLEGLQQPSSESRRHLWVCGCPEAWRERMALMAVQLWLVSLWPVPESGLPSGGLSHADGWLSDYTFSIHCSVSQCLLVNIDYMYQYFSSMSLKYKFKGKLTQACHSWHSRPNQRVIVVMRMRLLLFTEINSKNSSVSNTHSLIAWFTRIKLQIDFWFDPVSYIACRPTNIHTQAYEAPSQGNLFYLFD